ncbi:MAG: hypothetical protein H8K07_01460 [Nitrospira sp.]|nr:hypothetical protein [Nitrospira sp.]
MPHDSGESLFVFPSMSLQARMLIHELGQLLARSGDRYVTHLRTELQLCAEANQLERLCACHDFPFECKILPFPARPNAGESSCVE